MKDLKKIEDKLIQEAIKSVLRAQLSQWSNKDADISVEFNVCCPIVIKGYDILTRWDIEELEKEWNATVFIHEKHGVHLML